MAFGTNSIDTPVTPGASASGLHIRTITTDDLWSALQNGWSDFTASPTHLLFLGIIYPIVGLVLAKVTIGASLLPLVFPLVTGFALLGPFAAIGIYEMSKRREQGLEPTWSDALRVVQSQSIGTVLVLGMLLCALFVTWLLVALLIYSATMGGYVPTSITGFVGEVLTTPGGWALMILGNAVGALFACGVLAISVISFPLVLDKHVDASTAIRTSVEAARQNLLPMAIWGVIVGALLVAGSLPLLIGLAVVMPVLGHATWRLYRRMITD